ncbi:MAG: ParB N-terminal domain-containing protein [Pyrinomonadaceae bacterium]
MSEPTIINQETRLVSVEDITTHPENPNRAEISRIVDSIEENGFYGTIVVQRSTGYIVKGNHTYRAAKAAGLLEVPVTYLDIDDDRAIRIMIADNRIAEFGERDEDVLKELLSGLDGLEGTGYSDEEFADLLAGMGAGAGGGGEPEDTDPNYERKVEAPVYEPKSETPPPVEILYDETKTRELLERIEGAEIPENVRDFLRAAAARHTVFDYEEIAEFYAHAEADIQALFEDSALVIIDFDAAVEGGFVKLSKELSDAYDQDEKERNVEEED